MKLAILTLGLIGCLFPLKVHPENVSNASPQHSAGVPPSLLDLKGHGFAIEYIDLRPHQKGQDNGVYDADVAITPVSLPNLDLPKFGFTIENVRSIEDVIEEVKPRIALRANDWIAKLQQDEQAFEQNRRKLSPLPSIKPAASKGSTAHLAETSAASNSDKAAPPQALSQSAVSLAPGGFDLDYLQFVPQHQEAADGLYKVSAAFTPHYMPDVHLPFVYQIIFCLQFENIRSIVELKEKVRPELARRIDAFVDGMRKDKQALEQDH